MACDCVSWPIVGSLDKSTRKNISGVFVFDHGNNCIYVTRNGGVFAFGKNGERKPLGCGSDKFKHDPEKIEEIKGEGEELDLKRVVLLLTR